MARYLIDTTVIIDVSRGVEAVGSRINAFADEGSERAICAIDVAEFLAAAAVAQHVRWLEWLDTFH